MKRLALLLVGSWFVSACGGSGSAPAAKEPSSNPPTSASTEASANSGDASNSAKANAEPAAGSAAPGAESDGVPQKCAEGHTEGICAPSRAFVKSLCGAYPKPDVALIMFSKSSPFTRVYMNRNMEGWYTSGQQSTSAKLMFDEEVVVLSHPKGGGSGGMMIGNGGTNYDVLRLDGVCSSVEPEAISQKRPPAPKHANVPWQQLEKNVRDALLGDPGVAKAEAARRKECKGTTGLGVMSPACAKADDHLSASIADYVAHGGVTPMPNAKR
jgi:hypothetical protein